MVFTQTLTGRAGTVAWAFNAMDQPCRSRRGVVPRRAILLE